MILTSRDRKPSNESIQQGACMRVEVSGSQIESQENGICLDKCQEAPVTHWCKGSNIPSSYPMCGRSKNRRQRRRPCNVVL